MENNQKPEEQRPRDTNPENNSNWDNPVPFDSFIRPPFPIQSLTPILSEMATVVADVTQTAVDASAMAILSMVSTAVSKKFIIRLTPNGDGWTEKNNLYTCIAMPSGERKSAIFSLLVKPILDYERRLQTQMATEEEVSTDRSHRLVADDVTPLVLAELLEQNNERIALLSTEGGIFDMLSSRHYGKIPNLDVFLKGFSGDRLTIDRKNAPSIIMNDPTITICLFVQPSILNALPERLSGRGLMGRFLYTLPETNLGGRDMNLKSVPPELSKRYHELIYRLIRFSPGYSVPLVLSPEALEVFQIYRAELELKLVRGGELSDDFLTPWAVRLPGQLLRIAAACHAVLQASNNKLNDGTLDNIISTETMRNTLLLSDYFIEHAKAIFGCLKSNPTNEDAKHLLTVLKRIRTPVYKRQILWSKVKGKFSTAEVFDNALEVLRERGFIRVSKVKSERGRDGTTIECHPLITNAEKTD